MLANNEGLNAGVFTDGDLKRLMQTKRFIDNLKISKFMTKKPYTIEKNTLATDILYLMNKKKLLIFVFIVKKTKKIMSSIIN